MFLLLLLLLLLLLVCVLYSCSRTLLPPKRSDKVNVFDCDGLQGARVRLEGDEEVTREAQCSGVGLRNNVLWPLTTCTSRRFVGRASIIDQIESVSESRSNVVAAIPRFGRGNRGDPDPMAWFRNRVRPTSPLDDI